MERRGDRGQGLVEFALVIPILLLLMLGAVELGRAWMTKNTMTGAAREAVRVYVVPDGGGQAAADARAWAILAGSGIDNTNGSIGYADNGAFSNCTVTVTHQFQAIFGSFIPGLDNLTLVSATSMRREY